MCLLVWRSWQGSQNSFHLLFPPYGMGFSSGLEDVQYRQRTQRRKPRPVRDRIKRLLIALILLASLSTACTRGVRYNPGCPAPALKTWTLQQRKRLANELATAQEEGRFPMMIRAILDYARMRAEIRACQGKGDKK